MQKYVTIIHVGIVAMEEHFSGLFFQLGLPLFAHAVDTIGPAPNEKHEAVHQQKVPSIFPPPSKTHFFVFLDPLVDPATISVARRSKYYHKTDNW